MSKLKQLRRIDWAMRNSRGKKKKKLQSLFNLLVKLSNYLWLSSTNQDDPNSMRPNKRKAKKIAMKIISGTEHTKINYHDDKGYVYRTSTVYNGNNYLVCKNSIGDTCKARAILKGNDLKNVLLVKDHSHNADKKSVDRIMFRCKLDEICKENPILSPLICYKLAKEKLNGKINRKHIPVMSYYYTFMYRSQKTKVPLLPRSIKQFTRLIEEAKNHSRYALDEDGSIFYRGNWRGESGNNIAFVSERTLQHVSREKKPVILLMDGTFRAVPRHLKFQQLYIINVIVRDRCFPLAFILMERRDCKSYKRVFSELKTLLPSMKVGICMSDYERATRKAILEEFPGVQLTGCYFHYVQNVMKACKRFGLLKNEDSENFKLAVNKIAALALLPSNFTMEGFDSISKSIRNSKRWDRFCAYWLFQWKNANISVYGLKHRTNNFSETLNRTINRIIGCKGPHIWKLVVNLQSLEMMKSDELEQAAAGLLPNRPNKKTHEFNQKVIRVTNRFEESEDVDDFLDEITFNDDLAKVFNVNMTFYDDLEQSEMIPNHYTKLTEFRKTHLRAAAVKRKRSSEAQDNSNKKQKK